MEPRAALWLTSLSRLCPCQCWNRQGLLDTRWAAFVRMLADAVNGTTGVVETRASYPSGLTIAGVASNASITVSAHTRQYASLAKPVQAGTVTGLTYGTTYYVYYDDLKRRGLVSYAATTTLTDAFSSPTNPARHYVGASPCPPPPGVQHNRHARLSAGVCMIRIERNPVFWENVAAHPACAPALMGATPEAVGYMAGLPIVLPLAAEHGGFSLPASMRLAW